MAEPKNILVVTADAGFGHRSAANAVAAALEEIFGDRCNVQVINPLDDRRAPAILRETQNDYDKFVRSMPELWRLNYQISDATVPNAVVERALIVLLFRVMRSILKDSRPDAVVCTHPFFMAPMNAYITLRNLSIPFLTAITDLTSVHRLWFSQGADMYLLPTHEAYEQALGINYAPERLEVTGIPINPAFQKEIRSKDALRAELGWATGIPTVLVVGSKRVKNLMNVLHVLNHSGLSFQLVLVAGGDDELFAQFKETHWHTVTHMLNFAANMPQLMHASDLIVSKAGGLTVTEALACGLPLLLVDVTPGQETGNATYVLEHKVGALAETPIDALETLYHWLDRDHKELIEMQQAAGLIGRPRSAYAVAELAWKSAHKGRQFPKSRLREWAPRLRELLRSNNISISDSD